MNKFHDVILASVREGVSDIHITGGQSLCLRKNGNISFNQGLRWTSQEIDDLVRSLLSPGQLRILRERWSVDFATSVKHVRLRINVFNTIRGLSLAVRLLPGAIPTVDKLNLHPSLKQICQEKSGLALICGTTGCGKSTTIAALVDEINHTRSAHIITLEDPIEYRFDPDKSFIEQREIGTHVPSFMQGLMDVLREDPDVIVIGELREPETIRLTLNAAESGHLVIASLHATKGEDAVYRISNSFPPEAQDEIRFQLASTLGWIIVQQLIFLEKMRFRIPQLSIIKGTQSVKGLIRENKLFQIENAAHTGKNEGMFTMERYVSEYLDTCASFINPHLSFKPSEESIPEMVYISSLFDSPSYEKTTFPQELFLPADQEYIKQQDMVLREPAVGKFPPPDLDSPIHVIDEELTLKDLITQMDPSERDSSQKTKK